MQGIHPDDRKHVGEAIGKALETGIYPGLEHRIVRPDGSERYVIAKGAVIQDADGRVAKLIGGCLDITERREAEERRRQRQKLEAIGQLSAGIAHNFNNLLMGILPNLELAMEMVDEEAAELIQGAQEAAVRAAGLVRQLTTFAGPGRSAPRRAEDIRALVQQTVGICRRGFDTRIDLSTALPEEPVVVVGDGTLLQQALLNILINARDALTEARVQAPTVRVEVERLGAQADELSRLEVAGSGPAVAIRIADNGPGMTAQTRQHVYEPFFTTKEVGAGTGLGLSTSLAIAKDHGGALDCTSQPGQGTMFTLYLPLSDTQPAAVEAKHGGLGSAEQGKPDSILVVDDEEPVRRALSRMLERAGYKVYSAAGGREALSLLADTTVRHDVKLVLLDLSMPGMPGAAVLREIRAVAPALPVVYVTGHTGNSDDQADGVILKPVRYAQLTTSVSEIFDRQRRRGSEPVQGNEAPP